MAVPARIETVGGTATLFIDGRPADTQDFGALSRVYDVMSGSDITGTEAEFLLLTFVNGRSWVLPEKTAGAFELVFRDWHDDIEAAGLFYRAYLAEIPRAWRPRVLGFMYPPRPRPLLLVSQELPEWKLEGPLRTPQFPRLNTV
jgi:hypothetical protein